jgi:hypothetical protein
MQVSMRHLEVEIKWVDNASILCGGDMCNSHGVTVADIHQVIVPLNIWDRIEYFVV